MPAERRALLIAMIGPAMQAIGLLWFFAHLLLHHLHNPLDPRHIFFEPSVLLVLSGFLVTLVCVPLAIEVARATPEELEVHVIEPEEDIFLPAPRSNPRRHLIEDAE